MALDVMTSRMVQAAMNRSVASMTKCECSLQHLLLETLTGCLDGRSSFFGSRQLAPQRKLRVLFLSSRCQCVPCSLCKQQPAQLSSFMQQLKATCRPHTSTPSAFVELPNKLVQSARIAQKCQSRLRYLTAPSWQGCRCMKAPCQTVLQSANK